MDLNTILFYAHSGIRHIVILVAVIALIKFIFGWIAKSQWSKFDQTLLVAYPVVLTIQWLLGIVLWLLAMSAWFMGRDVTFAEHFFTMTLALIPAHMATARVRRAPDDVGKYKNATILFLISTLLVGLGVARITGLF